MAKSTVTLRERDRGNGRTYLYLDIYTNGRRRCQSLGIYIYTNERTREEKAHNKEMRSLAESVRAKWMLDVRNKQFGFSEVSEEAHLIPYTQNFVEMMECTAKTKDSYTTMLSHLTSYAKANTRFCDVDARWAEGFTRHLTSKVSANSARLYLAKLDKILTQAVAEELLRENPLKKTAKPKVTPTKKEFLSIDELRQLIATPCPDNTLRDMFLFSALTGLRWSEVVDLSWGDVREDGEKILLVYTQRKTGKLMYQHITPQAADYLGERRHNPCKVFNSSKYHYAHWGYLLRKWIKDAGIGKKITFHCARHTFATTLVSQGVDLYVISSLLGHSKITTTQIYAKIVDKDKQEAVLKIPKL